MIEIIVNNETLSVPSNKTLEDILFLKLKQTSQNSLAVALNGLVVAKQDWETKIINQGDKILIIKATQGG